MAQTRANVALCVTSGQLVKPQSAAMRSRRNASCLSLTCASWRANERQHSRDAPTSSQRTKLAQHRIVCKRSGASTSISTDRRHRQRCRRRIDGGSPRSTVHATRVGGAPEPRADVGALVHGAQLRDNGVVLGGRKRLCTAPNESRARSAGDSGAAGTWCRVVGRRIAGAVATPRHVKRERGVLRAARRIVKKRQTQ
jgi:hypothetical protein